MKPWRAVKTSAMKTSQKNYALKPFFMLNEKKVSCISPIFCENKFVTDFSKKADPFNSFFCKTMLNY